LTAKKIIDGLNSMSYMIEKLLKTIDIEDVVESRGKLAGMLFCITGALSKPRKDVERRIESSGGEVKSGVGKGLTYLVQADPSSTSSKSEKAKKYGTKVIGEEELENMMK
jgi:DNA ligase (NAD+)